MTIPELQLLINHLLPILLTTAIMPAVAQLAKQPRFVDSHLNDAIEYGASALFAALGLWASGVPIDVTNVGAMVAASNALYRFYFKKTKTFDLLGSIGLQPKVVEEKIPSTDDEIVAEHVDVKPDVVELSEPVAPTVETPEAFTSYIPPSKSFNEGEEEAY